MSALLLRSALGEGSLRAKYMHARVLRQSSAWASLPMRLLPNKRRRCLSEVGSTSRLSAGWLSFVVLPGSQAPVFMGNVFKANEGSGKVPKGFNLYGKWLSSNICCHPSH